MRFASLIALSLTVAAGCGGPSASTLSQQNDELRRRVLELEGELQAAQTQQEELASQIETLAAQAEDISPEVARNTPQVTSLDIQRLSHVRDEDGDGRPDQLLLYLYPKDGRGRFMQIVGEATVHAVVIPDAGEPRSIARATLSPTELREAYRSTLTGVYYAVPVPLDSAAIGDDADSAHVKVTFTDGYTRKEHIAERTISLAVH